MIKLTQNVRMMAAAGFLMTSPAILAETTAGVLVGSNNVFRGLTATDNGATAMAGVDHSQESGLYAGAWGSNVLKGLELDVWAGFANQIGEIGYEVGYVTYNYSDTKNNTNTAEIKLGLSYGPGSVAHYIDSANDTTYSEVGVELEIPMEATLAIHYGSASAGGTSATDYSLGVSREYEGFDVSASYAKQENSDAIIYATLSKSFDL